MIYSSCNIYQRTFRKGLFITQYICNEHSERRRDRFIAPASSTKTIDCNLQNITDCNANNGKTQHHFREFRGHGHDKSAPTPTGWTWKNTFSIQKTLPNRERKIYTANITQGLFITQYIRSEHTARRRGRFIVPVFQSKPNGFNVSKWCELQRHFVELRGCGTMNCNTNGGKTQHQFREFRGHGHDKSAPTPTEWTWKNTFSIQKTLPNRERKIYQRITQNDLFIV